MATPQQVAAVQVNRRRTFTAKFEENNVVNIGLPRDTVLVGLYLKLSGQVKYTYGSAPAARAEGAMDALIGAVEVNTDTLGTIKYLRPQVLHAQQLAAFGDGSRKLYSAGATGTDYPTTEGPFQFGTSGQTTSFSETVYLPFEQIFCEPGMGREETYLNTKRCSSANLKLYCLPLARLNTAAGASLVIDPTSKVQIEVTTVERQDISGDVVFNVWKQIQKTETFSSSVQDKAIEINTENKLSGLMFYSVNGNKMPTNKLVKKLVLKKNGQDNLQEIDFSSLQEVNRNDYRINAPFAAGASRLDGFAHLNQISRRDLRSILDTTKANGGIYSLQLFVTTNDGAVDASLYGVSGQTSDLYIITEEITAGK
ncbi:MAG: hypothetical protein ACK41T_01065 [Pseudobdellovibrio sp.]